MAEERKHSAQKGSQGKTERPGTPAEGMPARVPWEVRSAVVLAVIALGLAVTALVLHFAEDDEGGTAVVVQPSPAVQPTPTPPSAAVNADDDPAWGPEDAEVTVIEFSDYQ